LLSLVTQSPRWSAAWQEHDHLRWAESVGLPVPRAVAVGTCRGPGTQLRGYLAIEELAGQQALHEVIRTAAAIQSPKDFANWKRGLIAELSRLCRELHGRRRFHRDLYLCHFFVPSRYAIVAPRDWRGQVAMIDLHRLAHHRFVWRWWQLKDLAQLLYSSDVPGITARDRLRFWKLYAGPGRRRGLGPWLRRLILVRWNNYRGHNVGRRKAA
jgi:heptose I phosphotransferase